MGLLRLEKNGNEEVLYFLGKRIFTKINKSMQSFNPIEACCHIPSLQELLDKGTQFPHPYGIIISILANIGNNCTIYQNVTIGTDKYEHGGLEGYYPTIGSNVTIYSGAVICGPVKIGDGAVIGANAVVKNDVPPKAVVAGVPAKIIKYLD